MELDRHARCRHVVANVSVRSGRFSSSAVPWVSSTADRRGRRSHRPGPRAEVEAAGAYEGADEDRPGPGVGRVAGTLKAALELVAERVCIESSASAWTRGSVRASVIAVAAPIELPRTPIQVAPFSRSTQSMTARRSSCSRTPAVVCDPARSAAVAQVEGDEVEVSWRPAA